MMATTLRSWRKMHERQQRADAGRGQRGKNRDRVDEALVEDAEHDVDGDQRGEDQQRFVGERVLERSGGSLEIGLQAGREVQLLCDFVDVGDGRAQRGVGRKVERDRDGRELSLMVDGERLGGAAMPG